MKFLAIVLITRFVLAFFYRNRKEIGNENTTGTRVMDPASFPVRD